MLKKAIKSATIKAGAFGVSTLVMLDEYKDSVVAVADVVTQNGEAVYHGVHIVVGFFTVVGITKGRLDAENKPPLKDR